MRHSIAFCFAFLVLSAASATAQPARTPVDGKVFIPLTIFPGEVAKPISRNALLPQYKDAIPGNKVQMFLRLFMEQDNFFGKDETAKRDKWNELPLAELPAKELTDYGGKLLGRDAVDGVNMIHVDWQLWNFLQRDGFGTLLPDAQKMRAIAAALKTRIRGQIRNGDHAGAIETLRTLYGLATSFEKHPTLIGQLVGIAIASVACDAAEELVQLPECPDLFWSFSDFPTPLISLRMGLQGERTGVLGQFKPVLEGPMDEADITRLFKEMDGLLAPDAKVKLADHFPALAADAGRVAAARTHLIEAGMKPAMVKRFGPVQVMIAEDVQQTLVSMDELFKYASLSLPEVEAGEATQRAMLDELKKNYLLAPAILPGFIKVKQAQARLDQRIAYLRVIEAIRLHVRDNGGALPKTIGDVKLPLPIDPVTGKAFDYAVKDGVATLSGGNANPGTAATNRFYQIRVGP
jgi:hypothetical protein